jgi:hypothetical protein
MTITKRNQNRNNDEDDEENRNNRNENSDQNRRNEVANPQLAVTGNMVRDIDFDGLNDDTDPTYENRETIFREMVLRKNFAVENVIGDGVCFFFFCYSR